MHGGVFSAVARASTVARKSQKEQRKNDARGPRKKHPMKLPRKVLQESHEKFTRSTLPRFFFCRKKRSRPKSQEKRHNKNIPRRPSQKPRKTTALNQRNKTARPHQTVSLAHDIEKTNNTKTNQTIQFSSPTPSHRTDSPVPASAIAPAIRSPAPPPLFCLRHRDTPRGGLTQTRLHHFVVKRLSKWVLAMLVLVLGVVVGGCWPESSFRVVPSVFVGFIRCHRPSVSID